MILSEKCIELANHLVDPDEPATTVRGGGVSETFQIAANMIRIDAEETYRSLETLLERTPAICDAFDIDTNDEQNPADRILLVLDNFFLHVSQFARTRAEELGTTLIFLLVASPHLQPIKPVWNSLKRTISPISTESADEFRALVEGVFLKLAHRLSFAAGWINCFLNVNKLR